ncbi:MAG: hypothetical protein WCF77_01935 [Minisyncoccia bacterium]|jgi:hypothetical protein
MTVQFKKCDCGGGDGKAHGNFYVGGEKSGFHVGSLEIGRQKLATLAAKNGLTTDEVAEVEAQLQAVGLDENASKGEEELAAFEAEAERTGVPVELLLALAGVL